MRRLIWFLFSLLPAAALAQSFPNATFNTANIQTQLQMLGSARLGLGSWTTTQRPAVPPVGTMGYNSTLGQVEVWNGQTWASATSSNFTGGTVSGATTFNAPVTLNGTTTFNGTITGTAALTGPLDVIGPNGSFGAPGLQIYPPLHADGVTSDDVALAAAAAACTTAGGAIFLPPGKILLTGAASITLNNCRIVGTAGPGSIDLTQTNNTTTILLTSTTVPPFILRANFSLSNINFYWPNQTTGTTVYPPLFSDDGTHNAGLFTMDHIAVLNAYDGWVETVGLVWVNFYVLNSDIYAVHSAFTLSSIGDAIHINGNHFTPGNWFDACANLSTCYAAVNTADQSNMLVHVNGTSLVEMTMIGGATFAWRYGIKIDDGARMASSTFDMHWDGMGTLVDDSANTTAGRGWVSQNHAFGGFSNGCAIPQYGGAYIGNWPCFNMGPKGSITISNFNAGSAHGDFVATAGGGVVIRDSEVDNVGLVADGADYYLVRATTPSTNVIVQNSTLSGHVGDVHAHGIAFLGGAPGNLTIQDSQFTYFEEILNSPTSTSTIIISGNRSANMTGTSDIILSDVDHPIRFLNNDLANPPLATLNTCGGTGATIQGGIVGTILVGSTVPTISCSFTLPFYVHTNGSCVFTSQQAVLPLGAATVTPTEWNVGSPNGTHLENQHIFFNCIGQQ